MKIISTHNKDSDNTKNNKKSEEENNIDNNSDNLNNKDTEVANESTQTAEQSSSTAEESTSESETAEQTSTLETSQQEQAQSETQQTETTSETTETQSETQQTETTEQTTSLITGQVTSEIKDIISGTVSKDSPYTYNLDEGESAEIISSSQQVKLKITDNIATITTDYSETGDSGFGKDYLGDSTYDLNIDLSILNLTARDGDMIIDLVYNGVIITSASTTLNVAGEIPQNITEINITETNITDINTTEINITANITENLSYNLTEDELFLLKSRTGTNEIKITKSEVINDRLIIRFEIGSYWTERSYNPDSSDLDMQIELDRLKWVKYLAQKLSEKNQEPEEVSKYLGNYSL